MAQKWVASLHPGVGEISDQESDRVFGVKAVESSLALGQLPKVSEGRKGNAGAIFT